MFRNPVVGAPPPARASARSASVQGVPRGIARASHATPPPTGPTTGAAGPYALAITDQSGPYWLRYSAAPTRARDREPHPAGRPRPDRGGGGPRRYCPADSFYAWFRGSVRYP